MHWLVCVCKKLILNNSHWQVHDQPSTNKHNVQRSRSGQFIDALLQYKQQYSVDSTITNYTSVGTNSYRTEGCSSIDENEFSIDCLTEMSVLYWLIVCLV